VGDQKWTGPAHHGKPLKLEWAVRPKGRREEKPLKSTGIQSPLVCGQCQGHRTDEIPSGKKG